MNLDAPDIAEIADDVEARHLRRREAIDLHVAAVELHEAAVARRNAAYDAWQIAVGEASELDRKCDESRSTLVKLGLLPEYHGE